MFAKTVCFLLTLSLGKYEHRVEGISCNFTFIESDDLISYATEKQMVNLRSESSHLFNCEQNFEDEYIFVNNSGQTTITTNRFNAPENYELQEVSCVSSKRFITPRALNNIYNQLIPVLNTAVFIQRMQIVECRTPREACNEHIHLSSNYKHICWQEYLTLKLVAIRDGGSLFDESFYYPSHCSCRLVKVSRRLRKTQIFYV